MKRPRLPFPRLVLIAATVALVVTGAHRIVGDAPRAAWISFHAAVPAVVFSLGVLSTGAGRFGPRTVLKGVLVVALVASAFGWINGHPLPALAAAGLNFLVPLAVSSLGAASSSSSAPGPTGRGGGRARPLDVRRWDVKAADLSGSRTPPRRGAAGRTGRGGASETARS